MLHRCALISLIGSQQPSVIRLEVTVRRLIILGVKRGYCLELTILITAKFLDVNKLLQPQTESRKKRLLRLEQLPLRHQDNICRGRPQNFSPAQKVFSPAPGHELKLSAPERPCQQDFAIGKNKNKNQYKRPRPALSASPPHLTEQLQWQGPGSQVVQPEVVIFISPGQCGPSGTQSCLTV